MRTTTFVRAGALLTAAALTLSLSNGPASADDAPSGSVPAVDSPLPGKRTGTDLSGYPGLSAKQNRGSVSSAAEPDIITRIGARNTVLYQPQGTSIDISLIATEDLSSEDISVAVKLRVSGVETKDFYEVYYDEAHDTLFANIPNSVGMGNARITKTRISSLDNPTVIDETDSNVFKIRRNTFSDTNPDEGTYSLVYGRQGSKIIFRAYKWKIFKPSTGKYVGMNSIRLQYRSNHKWKHLKSIKLSPGGSGSYSKRTSTKRRYRLYYPTTDTVLGTYTGATVKL